jgi:hypothetical protein
LRSGGNLTPAGFDDGEIYTMRADGTGIQNLTANNPTARGADHRRHRAGVGNTSATLT